MHSTRVSPCPVTCPKASACRCQATQWSGTGMPSSITVFHVHATMQESYVAEKLVRCFASRTSSCSDPCKCDIAFAASSWRMYWTKPQPLVVFWSLSGNRLISSICTNKRMLRVQTYPDETPNETPHEGMMLEQTKGSE